METCRCTCCGKKRKCATWSYVVKKNVRGRVRQYTPGASTVYTQGGRTVGSEQDVTYAVGTKTVNASEGVAALCAGCRILRSVPLILVLTVLISAVVTALPVAVLLLLGRPDAVGNAIATLPKVVGYSLAASVLYALTPWMKHLILKLRLSRILKIRPFWGITSAFWK